MNPYKIKPSPNPRIPINLQFFLTDDFHIEKVKKKLVQTQTDEMKGDGRVTVVKRKGKDRLGRDIVEYLPEQTYIPKKTGIDAFTQVENDELFNFDREVEPIIQVLITKTLEQGILELEEELEIENMRQFKKDYVARKVLKNDEDWKLIVEAEMDKIDEKEKKISEYTVTQIREENLAGKVCAQHLAHEYLRGFEEAALSSLESRGRYRAVEPDVFREKFLNYISKSVVEYLQFEYALEDKTQKLFPEVEPKLMKERIKFDEKHNKKQGSGKEIKEYHMGSKKQFYLYFENPGLNKPLMFSCFNSMILDNSFNVTLHSYQELRG
jgi:hypothetical protein